MRSKSIAVVAFEGISPFHLSLPGLVFGTHRSELGIAKYVYKVCAVERGKLQTSGGFTIEARHGLSELAAADVVIVPSWRDAREKAPTRLIGALQAAHERGAKLVGLCLGSFVIAETGLLDGRRATTHWCWASLFAERFPSVLLESDKLYVEEGDVLTSAGNAAGLDCCLHLFRSHHGAAVANRLARRLVISPHRQGGQAQFIERPMQADCSGDRLAQTLEWVQHNPALPHTINSIAQRACLSPRTLTRRFHQLTGTSVKRWLIDQRLTTAQGLLETSDATVEQIATSVGFAESLSLRQHFADKLHTTPSLYRKEFRSTHAHSG